MRINKLKRLLIATFCIVTALWTETEGMDELAYLAVRGNSGGVHVAISHDGGASWTGLKPIPGLVTDDPIGIASSNEKVMIAMHGQDSKVYVATSHDKGANWIVSEPVPEWSTKSPVGIAFSDKTQNSRLNSLEASETSRSMDTFPEEGVLYQIRNKHSDNCLNSWGHEIGKGTAGMQPCARDEYASHRLWYFEKEKDGEYYQIRNKYSDHCLDGWKVDKDTESCLSGMQMCVRNEYISHRLWSFEKNGEYYQIRSKRNGLCLNSRGDEIGKGTATTEACESDHTHRLWYFEKDRLSTLEASDEIQFGKLSGLEESDRAQNVTLSDLSLSDKAQNVTLGNLEGRLNNLTLTLEEQLKKQQFYIDGLELFSSSFVSGAAYSLAPEIIRDGIEFTGYSKAANVAATIIQGGMVLCHTASYIPTMTGMAVRHGASYLGCPNDVSAIAGSTASVVASVSQSLLLSDKTPVDCMTDCAIAFAGSYAGGVLALQAKSWVYDLGSYAGNAALQAKSWVWGNGDRGRFHQEHDSSALQKELAEKDKALKEKDKALKEKEDEIKRLKAEKTKLEMDILENRDAPHKK